MSHNIPRDVWLMIHTFFDSKTTLLVSQACKKWYNDTEVWQYCNQTMILNNNLKNKVHPISVGLQLPNHLVITKSKRLYIVLSEYDEEHNITDSKRGGNFKLFSDEYLLDFNKWISSIQHLHLKINVAHDMLPLTHFKNMFTKLESLMITYSPEHWCKQKKYIYHSRGDFVIKVSNWIKTFICSSSTFTLKILQFYIKNQISGFISNPNCCSFTGELNPSKYTSHVFPNVIDLKWILFYDTYTTLCDEFPNAVHIDLIVIYTTSDMNEDIAVSCDSLKAISLKLESDQVRTYNVFLPHNIKRLYLKNSEFVIKNQKRCSKFNSLSLDSAYCSLSNKTKDGIIYYNNNFVKKTRYDVLKGFNNLKYVDISTLHFSYWFSILSKHQTIETLFITERKTKSHLINCLSYYGINNCKIKNLHIYVHKKLSLKTEEDWDSFLGPIKYIKNLEVLIVHTNLRCNTETLQTLFLNKNIKIEFII